ncbi:uncharacterized protein [Pocillopora verrucosa]|uniref:uncharacterized protein isoform X2 n=1 Tax=Pocillopora verrucosa TaxID=203993 RepID=UPI00334162E6
MFPEHITVFIFVGLSFAQALGQNSTVVKPSPTASYTMAPMSSQAAQPTTKVPNDTKPTQSTTKKGETTPTTKSMKPTCAMISFVADRVWNESLKASVSNEFKALKNMTSMAMEYLYNDSKKYYNVKVSEVKFVEKDGKVGVEAKLCLVVKEKEGGLIEEVFTEKLKTGLFRDLKVMSEGAEFKPKGVDLKDWKAKEGECEKCSGAGGQITIERTCVPDEYSCNGFKVEKMTKDCVEYCGAVGITVSLLVLAFGMLLSFSSQ